MKFDVKDVKFRPFKSRGAGGQHKNTTLSAIEATHLPTGIKATASMRSQHQSKKMALKVLMARVAAHFEKPIERYRASDERIRTYHEPDNRVVDHRSGKQFSFRQTVGKGDISTIIEQWYDGVAE